MATTTSTVTRYSPKGRAVSPRQRKSLDKRKKSDRFAIHLRELMDAKGWQIGDLHEALSQAGVKFDKPAIAKWLRGDSHPHFLQLEALGKAFGLTDYRDVLPPPK
jgi:hypothetical protein